MNKKIIVLISIIILAVVVSTSLVDTNYAGYYKIRQLPYYGTLDVFFSPGMLGQYGGKITEYKQEGTYSFIIPIEQDKQPVEMIGSDGKKIMIQQSVLEPQEAELEGSTNTPALPIRYSDGGTGHIYGKIRFRFPSDKDNTLKIHQAFRSYDHAVESLVKITTQNVMNLTGALMTSEESYTTAKEKFQRWAEDQIMNGPYETKLIKMSMPGDSGKIEEVQRATILYDEKTGKPIYGKNPFKEYGVTLTQCQIVNWTYEPKTLEQIQKKREALMAIVQSKAEAEKAEQIKITAKAQGEANVTTAKYVKEVEKQQAVVDAEKQKEVAVISAKQQVEVAEQARLEAEKRKLAALETKQQEIYLGQGEYERKRLNMIADGALAKKLATYENVMIGSIAELAKQKWVPEVQMNNGGSNNGNSATALMDLFAAKVLKDLGLDLSIPKSSGKDKLQSNSK